MNKSEELAKLMGIESKYKRIWAESEFELENRAKKHNIFIHWYAHTNKYYIDVPLKLDFTKPSNFLKLIQVVQDSFEGIFLDGVSEVLGYATNIQEELILHLISCIKYKRCIGIIIPKSDMTQYYDEQGHIESFLENIKKIEWEY